MPDYNVSAVAQFPVRLTIPVEGDTPLDIIPSARQELTKDYPCFLGRQEIPRSSSALVDPKFQIIRRGGRAYDILVTAYLKATAEYTISSDSQEAAEALPVPPSAVFNFNGVSISDPPSYDSVTMNRGPGSGGGGPGGDPVDTVITLVEDWTYITPIRRNYPVQVLVRTVDDDLPVNGGTIELRVSATMVGTASVVNGAATIVWTGAMAQTYNNISLHYLPNSSYNESELGTYSVQFTPYAVEIVNLVTTPAIGSTIADGSTIRFQGKVQYAAGQTDPDLPPIPAGMIYLVFGEGYLAIVNGISGDFDVTSDPIEASPGSQTITVVWGNDLDASWGYPEATATFTVT